MEDSWLDDWFVEPLSNRVTRNGRSVRVEPKVMQVLLQLMRHPQKVVRKEDLMTDVWGAAFITPDVLTRSIYMLRGVLDKDLIQTIPTIGYRLTAQVRLAVPKTPRLVILPVINPDPETEYLSDGLTESITYHVARIPGLKVIARTSAFVFKQNQQDLDVVRERLRVDFAVTGTLRLSDAKGVIAMELIDVREHVQLWGRTYSRSLSSLASLDREIAFDIARELKLPVTAPVPPDGGWIR